MRTAELCSRDVVVIRPDESVLAAARLMRRHHVGSLVVVEDRAGGIGPIGMLTDRDLVVSVLASGEEIAPSSILVRDVIGPDVLVAHGNEGVWQALRHMRARGVRRVPVVDESERLIGILAFDDLIAWMSEQLTELTRLLDREQRFERTTRPSGEIHTMP